MTTPYRDILQQLREAFPQPVSNRVHDAYFVFSFLRSLDQVDAMKSDRPLLGQTEELDYESAMQATLDDSPRNLEAVTTELVEYLSGLFIWGHPRSQINVVPPPTIPSIIGGMLPSIYNPNLVSDESGRKIAVAEIEAIAMTAELLGYDAKRAGGVFTFGGTGTLLYAVKIGLEKACPGTQQTGVTERAVILCSDHAHYACITVANWLGLGEDNVIRIPTTDDNALRPCLLESHLRDVLKSGGKVAAVVATMGTTDAFGIDDVEQVREIVDRLADEFSLDYRPHIHADAVIGWAWSVFNEYDFEANPLEFRARTIRALAHSTRRIRQIPLADSVGIDYHKTGFCPYISSAFILKDRADLKLISRPDATMPYLFQSGEYHPGKFTLETTRSGSGPMAALANLRLFGRQGLQSLLGHLVTMAETLREHLESHAATTVLNRENFGPVTLFRVYPEGVDTFTVPKRERTDPAYRDQLRKHNAYNRRIFALIQEEALQGRGIVISLTDCYRESEYGEPIVALKSYILSPFSDAEYVDAVLQSLWNAQKAINAPD